MILLFLTRNRIWYIVYDRRHVWVSDSKQHSLILTFEGKNVGIDSATGIGNGKRGRLLFGQPGRDSKKLDGAM
jgi:hypothetical protein